MSHQLIDHVEDGPKKKTSHSSFDSSCMCAYWQLYGRRQDIPIGLIPIMMFSSIHRNPNKAEYTSIVQPCMKFVVHIELLLLLLSLTPKISRDLSSPCAPILYSPNATSIPKPQQTLWRRPQKHNSLTQSVMSRVKLFGISVAYRRPPLNKQQRKRGEKRGKVFSHFVTRKYLCSMAHQSSYCCLIAINIHSKHVYQNASHMWVSGQYLLWWHMCHSCQRQNTPHRRKFSGKLFRHTYSQQSGRSEIPRIVSWRTQID